MNVVAFTFSAKVGHFLRAEANANGLTYPVPPRTTLLGLCGAVLGLEKDAPQCVLAESHLAVGGEVPKRFWHKTNVRKDPPAPLPFEVKAKDKGTSKDQRNFRFPQEWLWRPRYRVWANLPERYHTEFVDRLQEQRWYFNPCMGLSEMLADLSEVVVMEAQPLQAGVHRVVTVAPQDAAQVNTTAACADDATLQVLRMPNSATEDRVFSHRAYWLEIHGKPLPAETSQAWQCGSDAVVFL